MKHNEKLNQIFNVAPTEIVNGEVITQGGEVIVPEFTEEEKTINYDYEKTRANLHTLLAQGQEALMYALEVAKQSEHPRAFEVVGGLVKQLADVNHQLLDLTEKKQKLHGKKEEAANPASVTNNAIFVGSTAELNNVIKNLTKGE